ncbi:MAG: riboflavin synthase [Phycisphaerae bacterium]|nr:riboflavin synthase [Phycisphaerae bacterium]
MFTGLIETIGTITTIRRGSADSLLLAIDLKTAADGVRIGDSIAVNGACLSVTKIGGTTADFDVSGETLEKSTLGSLRAADKVNIERAIAPHDRFGGHFVLGHVDGTGSIKRVEDKGRFRDVWFSAAPETIAQLVPKGSVAIDGISLTIASIEPDSFRIAVIPHTWQNTNLSTSSAGKKVNIEVDLITKTIRSQIENMLGTAKKDALTIEKLKNMGF